MSRKNDQVKTQSIFPVNNIDVYCISGLIFFLLSSECIRIFDHFYTR